MTFATKFEVHKGTKLAADGGFTCIPNGAVLVVEQDEGGLFIPCAEGHHYLDGQLDEGNEYIGLTMLEGGEQ